MYPMNVFTVGDKRVSRSFADFRLRGLRNAHPRAIRIYKRNGQHGRLGQLRQDCLK